MGTETITPREYRKAILVLRRYCGSDDVKQLKLRKIIFDRNYDQTPQENYYTFDDKKANTIKMLCGPHYHAVLKAIEIKHDHSNTNISKIES